MNFGIFGIINIIAIFQLAIFLLFLLTRKRKKVPANKYLSIFLLAQALVMFNSLCISQYDFLFEKFPHLFFTGFPFILVWGPSLFFYVKSLTEPQSSFKIWNLIHYLPFFLLFIILLFCFHINDADTKRTLLDLLLFKELTFVNIINGFRHIQIFVYLILSLLTLGSYRLRIKEQFSSIDKMNLNWLQMLLYGYIFGWFVSLLTFILNQTSFPYMRELNIFGYFIFLLFFNIIFFKGWTQPIIFSGVLPVQKYQYSKLTSAEAEKYLEILTDHMELAKSYLKPDLTIKELSEEISIPERYLSQVINMILGQNFYDFINRYRIREAKNLINDSLGKKTILEILFDVGFNTKSAFNNAFKKFTNMSPSEYKRASSSKK